MGVPATMLRFLAVRHLAVIDHLDVEFEPGLNVITGETGAGKSVLVEAIDLLMGARANPDLVRTGAEQASVQAVFERADGREVIVRREISAQGRSRAFIDDSLASSSALRDLCDGLIELHGQHEHQVLLDPSEHVALLDEYGRHEDAVAVAAARYDDWRRAIDARERAVTGARDAGTRLDMIAFDLAAIDRVAPRPDEEDRLGTERARLANADRLARLSDEAYAALYDGDTSALAQLALVWKRIDDLAAIDARFNAHAADRTEIKARLEDLAFALREARVHVEDAGDRLQAVEDRLAALERVKRRYGPSIADVLERRAALAQELRTLESREEDAGRLETAVNTSADAYLEAARALRTRRRTAAETLAPALRAALADLAMPGSRVEIALGDCSGDPGAWLRSGVDQAELRLSPNPGEDLRPLARIASGGELSRIMLALRTLTGHGDRAHTVVFDEVDAGIGGAAADAVGLRLQELGVRSQVLCVTHLAQVAAHGSSHFRIDKQVSDGRTLTTVHRLTGEERAHEIGRMIAGAAVSPAVLASARDLLTARSPTGEHNTKVNKGAPATPRARSARA